MGRDVLFIDPAGGIAGDMFLAACLDLGVSLDDLKRELSKLGPLGFELQVRRAFDSSIAGLHVEVKLDHADVHERAYRDIVRLIDESGLSAQVKESAKSVFRVIGEAEAHVHHKSLEAIHFHEVGAIDSIVDICGAAVCLERLGWPIALSLPPPAGSGTIQTVHGLMPVPAPATLEILRGRGLRPSGPGERTTPTGAGLLAALTDEVERMPELVVERVGYGVGTKSWPDAPNIVRLVCGRAAKGHGTEAGLLVQTNLDDASGQLVARAIDALLEGGAADAWATPVVGKKGRPGLVLSALCAERDLERVRKVFVRETPTLGVRVSRHERWPLDREQREVWTPWGSVLVKLGREGDEVVNIAPEHDDCLALARAHGVPLKRVLQAAVAAAQALYGNASVPKGNDATGE